MIHSGPVTVSVHGGERINVIHMKPPLQNGAEEILAPGDTHWLGTLPELESETLESISREGLRLVQKVAPSPKAIRDYDFRLHGVEQSDPNTNDKITLRASCSSLLEHCYETAGIDLVEEATVPEVMSETHLGQMIGLEEAKVRSLIQQLRPAVSWPCRILFPSYQMKAFEKNLAELPYEPQLSDHPYVQPIAEEPAPGMEEDADLE